MHRAVYNWIKNVYNLGIPTVETGGYSSPALRQHLTKLKKAGYIHTVFLIFSAEFHQVFTQLKTLFSPLNNRQFYTLSTYPTITKAKEK